MHTLVLAEVRLWFVRVTVVEVEESKLSHCLGCLVFVNRSPSGLLISPSANFGVTQRRANVSRVNLVSLV